MKYRPCYGTMFPRLVNLLYTSPCRGTVLTVLVCSSGIGMHSYVEGIPTFSACPNGTEGCLPGIWLALASMQLAWDSLSHDGTRYPGHRADGGDRLATLSPRACCVGRYEDADGTHLARLGSAGR